MGYIRGLDLQVALVDPATGLPLTLTSGLAVDTELPAAAALTTAGLAIPTTPTIATALYGYNGATLDLLKSTVANGLAVDVTRVTGTVTVDSEMPAAALDADSFDIAATAIPKVGAVLHAMSAGGTLAGRVLSHTSASDGRANTLNGLLVQAVPYVRNAAGTNDAQRGINAATGTTGTGLPGVGTAVWDATNYQRTVQAITANGSAVTGIPAMALAGYNGTNFDPIKSTTTTQGGLLVATALNTSFGDAQNTLAGIRDEAGAARIPGAALHMFGGTNYERVRNNVDVTLLASAGRTTTQTSADIVTYNSGAIVVIVDVTVIGTGNITMTINGKDPASGKYYLLLSGAAIAGNSTNVYWVDPAQPAVANVTAQRRLPRTIQIVITANNANSVTYSVGYTLMPV